MTFKTSFLQGCFVILHHTKNCITGGIKQKRRLVILSYKNIINKAILLSFILIGFSSFSQNLQISVKDEITKEALSGATIKLMSLPPNTTNVVNSKCSEAGTFSINTIFPICIKIINIGYETILDTLTSSTVKTYSMKSTSTQLNAVSITADYTQAKAKQSVHDIKIIDKKTIEQKGANNLRELLMTELSSSISQDNILGTGISQQGLSGENIKILIDGVPVIGRLNGNIDLSQINLNNVERVEIIEGPLSVLYGSNALGGVVNIITKQNQNETIQGSINSYYEHIGQYNIDASIGAKYKNNIIQVNGGRYFFDGFSAPDTTRFKQWKPKEQYFADASYLYNSTKFIYRLKGEYYDELITDRGTPRAPYGINAFDNTYRTNRYNISSDALFKFKKDKSLQIKGAYNYFKRQSNNYFKDLTNLESVMTSADNQDTSIFTNIMARGIYSFYAKDKKLTYQMGIDINYETGKGRRIFNNNQNIGDYAYFASMEYKPTSNLIFKPAVRLAYNSKYRAPIVPSLNIKYKPLANLTFRASYARGFRAPSLKELYFFFVDINHNIRGNADLKAETSHNFQFSYDYVKQVKKDHVLNLEGTVYYNDVKNMIRLASQTGTLFTYVNIANNKTTGANVELSYTYKNLRLKGGFQVNAMYSDFGNGVKTNGFETTPVATFDASYTWKKTGLNFAVFYKYTGKQPGVFVSSTDELKTFYFRSYHLLDMSISRNLYKDVIRLTIGGKNLCNVRNITATGDFIQNGTHSSATNSQPVGWGASFYTALHINFNNKTFKKTR
jgi:outer membrane receptor for ferrienterochelin and colicins